MDITCDYMFRLYEPLSSQLTYYHYYYYHHHHHACYHHYAQYIQLHT